MILARYAKMQPAIIEKMTRASFDTTITPDALQPTLDAAYKFKIIDAPVRATDVIARV